jgi:hypothetical protein
MSLENQEKKNSEPIEIFRKIREDQINFLREHLPGMTGEQIEVYLSNIPQYERQKDLFQQKQELHKAEEEKKRSSEEFQSGMNTSISSQEEFLINPATVKKRKRQADNLISSVYGSVVDWGALHKSLRGILTGPDGSTRPKSDTFAGSNAENPPIINNLSNRRDKIQKDILAVPTRHNKPSQSNTLPPPWSKKVW